MSILITGGTGFLGAHVTRHLVQERGEEVVVFDRFPTRARLADILDRFTLVEGDVLEAQDLMWVMADKRVDRVIHLAGVPGAALPDRGLQYVRTQCMGTANVFETARLHGVTRVVNASSVAVFGRDLPVGKPPVTEADSTAPGDLYGACKLWSEHLANFYNQDPEFEILSLRVAPTLGMGRLGRASLRAGLTRERRNYMAAPEIIALGEPVTMPPDDQVADFLYVADAAEAIWQALTEPRPEHSVFNLGGEHRPLGDFTRILRDLMPEGEIGVAPGDARFVQLMDTRQLATELHFQRRYTLEQALAEYVEQVERMAKGDR